jgi:hypothetical protein
VRYPVMLYLIDCIREYNPQLSSEG